MATSTTSANTDIGSTNYARRRRELFELTKALRNLRADAELGRPRIVVIGGQSSGKSSLVEAVTGIKVPRDSGTCTRCPMECYIRGGTSAWSCQISLKRHDADSRALISSTTTPFGDRITYEQDVDMNIRRAQAAILCPHRSHEEFVNKSQEELKQMLLRDPRVRPFSRDVIVVDIEDPDGTDIFFVDLPGLIQNAPEQEIQTVKELVEESIAEENTIILVTIPASDDLENQQAIKLARIADPQGVRTIGVITKPDTLTPGATSAIAKWKSILTNVDSRHALKLGYYCVRLPDDTERDRTRAEMKVIEKDFFRATRPWSDLRATNRLGVRALVKDLGEQLMNIIEQTVPEIARKLQACFVESEQELRGLPKPVTVDPATEILNRVTAFCRDLQEVVSGRCEDKTFVHRNRAVYRQFAAEVRKTAPNFQPYEGVSQQFVNTDFEVVEEGDASGAELVMPPLDLYAVRQVIEDSIAWELPRNIPYDAKKVLIKKSVVLWTQPSFQCFGDIREIVAEEVNVQIDKHFKHFKHLKDHIEPIVLGHAANVVEACHEAITVLLAQESSPYFTQNLHYLDYTYETWLSRYQRARQSSRQNPSSPRAGPRPASPSRPQSPGGSSRLGTPRSRQPSVSPPPSPRYNPASSSRRTSGAGAAPFIRSALGVVGSLPINPLMQQAFGVLAELGFSDLEESDLARLSAPDPFDAELRVMADVRAYFQVAHKRMIDNVPLTIHHALCHNLAESMQAHLIDQLQLGTPDASQRFRDLLAEDPQVAGKRSELQNQIAQLAEARRRLQQV